MDIWGEIIYGSNTIQRYWKDYKVIIHNTYHGGHIENDHHFICSILEDMEKHLEFPNFTIPVLGTLREILENFTRTNDKYFYSMG